MAAKSFQVWDKDRFQLSLRDLTKSLCDNELANVPECRFEKKQLTKKFNLGPIHRHLNK